MKYIDAEKLKYEIERRKLSNYYTDTDDYEAELFEIIGSLQQEQQEGPVPNDLDEAANKFAVFYDQGTCDGIAQDCFISGAKWQAEQDEKEQADLFTIVALDAAQRAKEQMMKEAVEGEVMLNPYPTICLDDCKDYDFKDGDKVRIIIVKED